MAKKKNGLDIPIGERLRTQRIEVVKKGLREMAGLLGISPPHLTDIEKGNRSPSEDLLVRISKLYNMDEIELRTAWEKVDTVVNNVAKKNSTTMRRVPEFLRTASDLTDEQWQDAIRHVQNLKRKK
ncbi:MAG: helix-turn-helix transcriptional regulator [Phycisphaeraceae bacterium]|nr:helix-turn-helix transcriptional regulator [Phycisphaeraceae bacterium]